MPDSLFHIFIIFHMKKNVPDTYFEYDFLKWSLFSCLSFLCYPEDRPNCSKILCILHA